MQLHFRKAHSEPRLAQPKVRQRSEFWLFFLFATYGPAIHILGELRYLEIVVLLLLVYQFSMAVKNIGEVEKIFLRLFLLTAFAYIVTDLYHDSPIEGTLKRTATYVILALLIIGTRHLVKGSPRRLQLVIVGYCFSYVIVYLFHIPVVSASYQVEPWRLGLGTAMAVLLCVVITAIPRLMLYRGVLLVAMSMLLLAQGARSLGAIVLATGLLAILAQMTGKESPVKVSLGRFGIYTAVGLVGVTLSYQLAIYATNQRWYPEELQKRMEEQVNNPVGLLAAGRPDTATALYAISRRPITGYGTGHADPEIAAYYGFMASATYYENANYGALLNEMIDEGFEIGIPSHSHIFSAWAEGGILAIWSWVFTLGVCLFVAVRCALWNNGWAPLFILVASQTIWDVLFSPGPERMDMAVRVVTLCFALDLFRHFDSGQTRLAMPWLRTSHGMPRIQLANWRFSNR